MFDKSIDKLKGVSGGAIEKVNELIGDFNDAMPTIKALGLSVSNFRIGMGIIPEIGATLLGSVEALDAGKIKELIEKHQDNKILKSILEALRSASNFRELLGELPFKGVKVNVDISLPPKIDVNLLQ
jgi:hypothetical protein